MSNAARFPKEHCFWRFPGFANLSWYEKYVDDDVYGALVEWYWDGKSEIKKWKWVIFLSNVPQLPKEHCFC